MTSPNPSTFDWIRVTEPRAVPSEWLALDLGAGEVAAIALALENRERVLLLDDAFARRIATAAGLNVWGTLKVLLEGKSRGLTATVSPYIERLVKSGMWIFEDVRRRVLVLAGE